MEITYEVKLEEIYLQNFTHATHLQILLFSASSYSQIAIALLKKNKLAMNAVQLAVLNEFQQIEFRVMQNNVLISADVKQQVDISELFQCPVKIQVKKVKEQQMQLFKQHIYVAVYPPLCFNVEALYFECDCGHFSIFKRIKDEIVNYEVIELLLEEEVPQQFVFRLFEAVKKIYLPIVEQKVDLQRNYYIFDKLLFSSEMNELLEKFNKRISQGIEEIVYNWPIQHNAYSYVSKEQKDVQSFSRSIGLKQGFMTIHTKENIIECVPRSFARFKEDYQNFYYIIKNVKYQNQDIPFLGIQGQNFQTILNQFILSDFNVQLFCNGEYLTIPQVAFDCKPGSVVLSLNPYTIELYGVKYVYRPIEIEDEVFSLDNQDIKDKIIDELERKLPSNGKRENENRASKLASRLANITSDEMIDLTIEMPEVILLSDTKQQLSLSELQYQYESWQLALNSLQILDFRRDQLRDAYPTKMVADLCEGYIQYGHPEKVCLNDLLQQFAQLAVGDKVRVLVQALKLVLRQHQFEFEILDNEVIIQKLSFNLQHRVQESKREKIVSLLKAEIRKTSDAIRSLQ